MFKGDSVGMRALGEGDGDGDGDGDKDSGGDFVRCGKEDEECDPDITAVVSSLCSQALERLPPRNSV